ncbi:MAG: hypothetical protein ABIF87_06775 [Pseudomonadota bacterium]
MEFLCQTELAIPLVQVVFLLLFSTLALLFGRVKLALLINYLFTFYWGYVFNGQRLLATNFENMSRFVIFYFVFGFAIAIFALIGFLVRSD